MAADKILTWADFSRGTCRERWAAFGTIASPAMPTSLARMWETTHDGHLDAGRLARQARDAAHPSRPTSTGAAGWSSASAAPRPLRKWGRITFAPFARNGTAWNFRCSSR